MGRPHQTSTTLDGGQHRPAGAMSGANEIGDVAGMRCARCHCDLRERTLVLTMQSDDGAERQLCSACWRKEDDARHPHRHRRPELPAARRQEPRRARAGDLSSITGSLPNADGRAGSSEPAVKAQRTSRVDGRARKALLSNHVNDCVIKPHSCGATEKNVGALQRAGR
jgi:hypothetical protein